MTDTLKPCDIFMTRGSGFLSRAIRFFTQKLGESRTKVNHVGIIVEGGSIQEAVVIEALSRVRRHRLWDRYASRRKCSVAVYRPLNLTQEEIQIVVNKAGDYEGREYGWEKLIAHFLNGVLLGVYFFRRFALMDEYPICSWVVACAFAKVGKTFDVEPNAASPDDIWDFIVETRSDLFAEVRPLTPLVQ